MSHDNNQCHRTTTSTSTTTTTMTATTTTTTIRNHFESRDCSSCQDELYFYPTMADNKKEDKEEKNNEERKGHKEEPKGNSKFISACAQRWHTWERLQEEMGRGQAEMGKGIAHLYPDRHPCEDEDDDEMGEVKAEMGEGKADKFDKMGKGKGDKVDKMGKGKADEIDKMGKGKIDKIAFANALASLPPRMTAPSPACPDSSSPRGDAQSVRWRLEDFSEYMSEDELAQLDARWRRNDSRDHATNHQGEAQDRRDGEA